MKAPEILVIGKFKPDDLVVSRSESNRKINPEFENKVDGIWEIKMNKAKEEGKICFNGTSYRLNSLKIEGGKIILDFGTIEFKTVEGLKSIPEYFNLSEHYFIKQCFNSSSVKTSDDGYLMVRLSGKSMNTNSIDLIGGMMEKPVEMNTGDGVFNSMYAELEEEGCIKKSDIKEIYLRAIYRGIKTGIGFYFEVILNIPSEELIERFKKENKDQDINSLDVFTKEDYLTLLKNHTSENKHLIASIINV